MILTPLFFIVPGVKWGLKSDFRYGVLRYMDFQLRLLEHENWLNKIGVDKERCDIEKERFRGMGKI